MSLTISKGIITLKGIFRGLDFDLRASFCEALDRGNRLGQGMAD